ncbi:glycosyltransferase [Parapedobacter lycopersici]|uniref:glycosyltransferase n=1 Tax=Parapedobacter lycopersici TaxID=1864939 RepID=UPI00214DE7B1|nr:glycosyltransferase [Parapedobacter lycopersici]
MKQNNSKKVILFFSPFFSRTGSEIMLLEFIRGLDRERYNPHLFVFEKGELVQEVPDHIPCYLPYRFTQNWKVKLLRKWIRKRGGDLLTYQLHQLQKQIKADFWYLNTIAIPPQVYEIAAGLGVKVVTHVHELLFAYGFFPRSHLQNILTRTTGVVCCSNAVRQHLTAIDYRGRLWIQHNFLDTDKIDDQLRSKTINRQSLQIKDDEFVWVASARTTYLKGLDCLPAILQGLQGEKYKIIWLGNLEDSSFSLYIERWVKLHYADRVIFAGQQTDRYYQYMALADGFLITSKEESFSLTAAEATYLDIPIVCFDFGAADEVISPPNAHIVPSWNVADFIQAMKHLMHQGRGPKAEKQKKLDFPFSKRSQMEKFNRLLDEITNSL